MDMMQNKIKQKLQQGQSLVGGWSLSGSAVAAEALGYVGYDYVVLDLEHSTTAHHHIIPYLTALDASQTPAIVRMASHDKIQIKQILDLGAQSLYFPFVQTVAEARQIACACAYPPHGDRGYARMHRAGRYLSIEDYFERSRDEMLIVAQLETPEALERATDIAAVPGIDALFIGPGDLSVAMGLPGQVGHEDVQGAMAEIAAKCRAENIWLGTVMPTAEAAKWAFDVGFRFVSIGNDLAMMVNSAKSQLQNLRKLETA